MNETSRTPTKFKTCCIYIWILSITSVLCFVFYQYSCCVEPSAVTMQYILVHNDIGPPVVAVEDRIKAIEMALTKYQEHIEAARDAILMTSAKEMRQTYDKDLKRTCGYDSDFFEFISGDPHIDTIYFQHDIVEM